MYNRDKIMRKLLGTKSTPEPSNGNLASVTSNPTPNASSYRPSKSQSAVYAAGVPISRLDVSPDRRAAVLGGSQILKTLVLDDPASSSFRFTDGVDVRAAIIAQQAHHAGGTGGRATAMADQLNIRDVKWHGNSTIFTAGANGRIFAYDLARIGTGGSEPLECIQMQEDSRQVNTLDVNPHLKSWVLSGSQDGMTRIFDASAPQQNRGGFLTFRQRFAPLRCIDSVRQVKWSPRVGHEMACCTESGIILKWDVRQPGRPLMRLNAHEKVCTAIAWHPDGNHLISAGWDTKLHVWDFGSTSDKRQKPKWTLTTPAPVTTLSWRPGLWSATTQSRRVAQVAVTYDESTNKRYGSSVVHIWDIARPTMPYKEVDSFDSSPLALWWKDQDMLWTAGQDGMFNQCDVAFAPKVIDRMSMSTMAFSSRGDALLFLDERLPSPRPRLSAAHHQHNIVSRTPYSSVTNTPGLSVSKSDSEEEIVSNFLGPRWKTQRRRRPSMRSGSIVSTTPPSGPSHPDDPKSSMDLEHAIKATGVFKSLQGMASGHVPAAKTVQVYQYLSNTYLEILAKELPHVQDGKPLVERLRIILEQFAKAAEAASLFRLSQTWRILAYSMTLLLNQRAQYHLEVRLSRFQRLKVEDAKNRDKSVPAISYGSFRADGSSTPRFVPGQPSSFDIRSHSLRSLLSEEIESTSNVATPVARPADSVSAAELPPQQQYLYGKKLTPIIEPESLSLGPAAHGSFKSSPRKRLDSTPMSVVSQDSEQTHISSTEGYDFYDTDVLTKAIDVPAHGENSHAHWVPKQSTPHRKNVPRHDSDESFGQMFSISAGNKQSQSPGSEYYLKGRLARKSSADKNGDENGTAEYESRIRGEELIKSSPLKAMQRQKPEMTPITQAPEEIFMISQTTMSDETYHSQSSQSMQSMTESLDENGSYNDSHLTGSQLTVQGGPHTLQVPKPSRMMASQLDPTPHILETDYLPWNDDPKFPFPSSQSPTVSTPKPPLDPYVLVKRALEFETRTSALNASAMVLLLKPLMPESVIDQHQARAILRQHHARLMGMGLFVEAALMRNLCVKGWPANLPDWGDNYTMVFEAAQQNVKVSFSCSTCHKAREIDRAEGGYSAIWTCERCKSLVSPCAVCGHRELEQADFEPAELADASSYETPTLLGWWYCPGCAHGGHASCLQMWHGTLDSAHSSISPEKYSGGCCPLDGCGHACLPGKYRGETTTARADELGRAAVETSRVREERLMTAGLSSAPASTMTSPTTGPGSMASNGVAGGGGGSSARSSPWAGQQPDRSSVRSDGNDVPQSRAVGMAREALNKAGVAGGGILSSSPGRASGERERRKSVKFAQPGR